MINSNDKIKIHTDNWVEKPIEFKSEFLEVTNENINNLEENDLIKISNGNEIFWVKIMDMNSTNVICKVDNELIMSTEYNKNDLITINNCKEYIYDIIKKDQVNKIRIKSSNYG